MQGVNSPIPGIMLNCPLEHVAEGTVDFSAYNKYVTFEFLNKSLGTSMTRLRHFLKSQPLEILARCLSLVSSTELESTILLLFFFSPPSSNWFYHQSDKLGHKHARGNNLVFWSETPALPSLCISTYDQHQRESEEAVWFWFWFSTGWLAVLFQPLENG